MILVALCLAVVVVSLLGGILPLWAKLTHTRLQLYLSFAAGTMLGAVFFHMMPQAVEQGSAETLRWSAVGLLALFFLERFFAFHHHESPDDPDDPCPTHAHEHASDRGHAAGLVDKAAPGHAHGTKGASLHWSAAAFGLAMHTLSGGVALASAWMADQAAGRGFGVAVGGVFLATIVHKPADALTIVSLMLRAGVPRATAHLVNLGFAMMVPLGAGLFLIGVRALEATVAQDVTAATLAFSAGTFLCISLSDLLPELQFHSHDRIKLSIALLAGMILMGATEAVEGHGHVEKPHAAQK